MYAVSLVAFPTRSLTADRIPLQHLRSRLRREAQLRRSRPQHAQAQPGGDRARGAPVGHLGRRRSEPRRRRRWGALRLRAAAVCFIGFPFTFLPPPPPSLTILKITILLLSIVDRPPDYPHCTQPCRLVYIPPSFPPCARRTQTPVVTNRSNNSRYFNPRSDRQRVSPLFAFGFVRSVIMLMTINILLLFLQPGAN